MNVFLLFIGCFCFCLSSYAQYEDTTTYAPVQLPAGFTSQIDVVYAKVGNWDGRMDLYLPAAGEVPTPLIINIHGGGWNHGVKESQTGYNTFFKAGFAVANVEYRLTGQATAPAAIEDVRCALIYIIKHAKELNVDANKIVIMGGSAGAHLALMAGMLGNDAKFDSNCAGAVKEIKVAAIIDKYGITDVYDWGYGKVLTSKSARNWLGKYADDKKFAASVSPISYVTANTPPTFIVHGDADPTVPYQQSVDLFKKLKANDVMAEMITVAGGGHGKFDKEKNSEINKAIMVFIMKTPAFKK